MAKASDNPFPSILLIEQAAAPATPSSGQARLYRGDDGALYVVDDTGTVTAVGGGGGGTLPGAWTAYTPTLANWTLGNGTLVGRYVVFGNTVHLAVKFTIGSTTTTTSGVPIIGFPAGHTPVMQTTLSALAEDVSASKDYALGGVVASSMAGILAVTSSGFVMTNTTPFTWAAGDWLAMSGTYELA